MSLYSILERFGRSHSEAGDAHAFAEGLWIPAGGFSAIPGGATLTYAEDQAGIDCAIFTASGAQTAILEAAVPLPGRLTAGRGVVIADVTFFYAVLTASLTSLTVTCKRITWAAANAVAAAPTVTAMAVTTTPASLTLTASAAQAFYTAKAAIAATNASVTDLETVRIAITAVMANTGVLKFHGAQVHYATQ